MKLPWTSLVAAAAGLVSGIGLANLLGERGRQDGAAHEIVRSKASPPRRPVARSEGLARPGASKSGHRLQNLFTLNWQLLKLDDTDRLLMKTDLPTLKGWLDGLTGRRKQDRSLHVLNLRNRVIREIYRREGTGLLAWAETMGHVEVMGEGLRCLGRDDAKAAAAWIGRFKALQQSHATEQEAAHELQRLTRDLHEAALFQGPAAIDGLRLAFGSELDRCLEPSSLPDDFDHAAFLRSLEPAQLVAYGGASRIVASWALRDRHAAFALARSVDATSPPGGIRLTPEIFYAVARLQGEEAAARWLSEELVESSEDQRGKILGGLFPHQAPSPAASIAILKGLSAEEDGVIFSEAMERRFPNRQPGENK